MNEEHVHGEGIYRHTRTIKKTVLETDTTGTTEIPIGRNTEVIQEICTLDGVIYWEQELSYLEGEEIK